MNTDDVFIQARKLGNTFIQSKLSSYSLNFDDGTIEGIEITIRKPTKKEKEHQIFGNDNKVITIGEVRKIFSHMYENLPDGDEELFKTVKQMSKEVDLNTPNKKSTEEDSNE